MVCDVIRAKEHSQDCVVVQRRVHLRTTRNLFFFKSNYFIDSFLNVCIRETEQNYFNILKGRYSLHIHDKTGYGIKYHT